MHHRGGSLNIQELYSHYQSKTKNGVNAAQAVIASSANGVTGGPTRIANHQPAGTILQNNLVGTTQFGGGETPNPQLYAGTGPMQVVARKQPVTQHQQHRSHSVNTTQIQLTVPTK